MGRCTGHCQDSADISSSFHKYQAVVLDVFFNTRWYKTLMWDKFCAGTDRTKFVPHEMNWTFML